MFHARLVNIQLLPRDDHRGIQTLFNHLIRTSVSSQIWLISFPSTWVQHLLSATFRLQIFLFLHTPRALARTPLRKNNFFITVFKEEVLRSVGRIFTGRCDPTSPGGGLGVLRLHFKRKTVFFSNFYSSKVLFFK